MNEMQWRRQESGGLELFVKEDEVWKLYTGSKNFVKDCTLPKASRGLETFRNCLKQGYKVLDVNGLEIL